MYKPLCVFKHGNPLVQQHIAAYAEDASGLAVFPTFDRRCLIALYWAIEAGIRSGWIGLVSLVSNHVTNVDGLREIINGINRSLNELMIIRDKAERQHG